MTHLSKLLDRDDVKPCLDGVDVSRQLLAVVTSGESSGKPFPRALPSSLQNLLTADSMRPHRQEAWQAIVRDLLAFSPELLEELLEELDP